MGVRTRPLQFSWIDQTIRVERGSPNWTSGFMYKRMGASKITAVLPSFTSLTHLNISLPTDEPSGDYEGVDWNWISRKDYSRPALPSLTHLTLDFSAREDPDPDPTVIPFLSLLTLPALTSLTLLVHPTCHGETTYIIWEAFAKLVIRSKPPLKTIHTSYPTMPADELLAELFKHTPMLEEAPELYVGLGDDAFAVLASRVKGSGAGAGDYKNAPNFREVGFCDLGVPVRSDSGGDAREAGDDDEAEPLDVDTTLQLLSSRYAGGAGPLRKIYLMQTDLKPDPKSTWTTFVERVKFEALLEGLEIVERHYERTVGGSWKMKMIDQPDEFRLL